MKKINDSVVLYSTGCPRCDVLEKKLSTKGIEFDYVGDVDTMQEMGILEVPVLSVNGKLMSFVEANRWINEQ